MVVKKLLLIFLKFEASLAPTAVIAVRSRFYTALLSDSHHTARLKATRFKEVPSKDVFLKASSHQKLFSSIFGFFWVGHKKVILLDVTNRVMTSSGM